MSPRSSLLRRAVALGALHGPAELLPISSSGHVAVLPWLLGWSDDELDGELRKAFEVALHAGTAAALLITLRDEVLEAGRGLDGRRLTLIALSFAPPAVAGLALERPIEERLGTPGSVAVGLLAGSVAMALADRMAQVRDHEQAGAVDGLWLGIAQASALMPGVSRNGATLAAARFRGFKRPDANRLSRHAALPVIAGATALKGLRLYRRGVGHEQRMALAAGAAASFASTLVSTWVLRQVERDRSLLPYALYRSGLAAIISARLRYGRPPR
jgi:undecaprenyl-diphosphatase